MLTQCGPKCDVCNNYILPGANESINPFKMKCIEQELHCCDKCKNFVLIASEKNDWKFLPQGPLRKVFEDYIKQAVA